MNDDMIFFCYLAHKKKMSFVYCIHSDRRRTYVGATKNLARRLRQHNGELVGGAKSTRGRRWAYLFHVEGFRGGGPRGDGARPYPSSGTSSTCAATGAGDPVRRRWGCVRRFLAQPRWAHLVSWIRVMEKKQRPVVRRRLVRILLARPVAPAH